jgi:hypothetical protein
LFQDDAVLPTGGLTEIRCAVWTETKLVDDDKVSDPQLVALPKFQAASLKGSQLAELDEGIDPDGVEGGKVA